MRGGGRVDEALVGGASLPLPAVLDRRRDNSVKVSWMDPADEEDRDVVLDSLELSVVDAGLLDEELGSFVENGPDRLEPHVGFSGKLLGQLAHLMDDAVLQGLDAPLVAPLTLVRQDRPARERQQDGLCKE